MGGDRIGCGEAASVLDRGRRRAPSAVTDWPPRARNYSGTSGVVVHQDVRLHPNRDAWDESRRYANSRRTRGILPGSGTDHDPTQPNPRAAAEYRSAHRLTVYREDSNSASWRLTRPPLLAPHLGTAQPPPPPPTEGGPSTEAVSSCAGTSACPTSRPTSSGNFCGTGTDRGAICRDIGMTRISTQPRPGGIRW